MKKMKKRLALLLAAVIAASCTAVAFAADGSTGLQFGEDGKFRIMVFADAHDDEDMEQTTAVFMREALDECKPDLVIYLGDNTCVSDYDKQVAAIDALTAPARERDIPFAMVFGNHDDEFGMSKEEIFEIYRSFGCLSYDAVPELHGVGNCNLPIRSSDGSRVAFNLWLIDSGSYNDETDYYDYDYIRQDQIDWYKKTAASLAGQNGGKAVPAIDFQHIVIPEIYDKLYLRLPFSLGGLTQKRLGKIYSIMPVLTRLNGYWFEQCCPPDVYDGQLDAWKEVGDVIAEFHGHDHKNSYQVNIDGVDVINVPTCGTASYNSDIDRGAGFITLDENTPENYGYRLIRLYNIALNKNSALLSAQGAGSKAHYVVMKIADAVVSGIFRFLRLFHKDMPINRF